MAEEEEDRDWFAMEDEVSNMEVVGEQGAGIRLRQDWDTVSLAQRTLFCLGSFRMYFTDSKRVLI